MTSFTRKLYAADPKAAEDFDKAQRFEHRLTYGKHVTLAQFDPGFSKRSAAIQGRTPRATFGQRTQVPPPLRQPCAVGCGDPACNEVCKLVPDALRDSWR